MWRLSKCYVNHYQHHQKIYIVQNPISTTIEGVDPDDPEWVEKASEIVGAAQGNDYVRLDHGLLTVDQIDMFLKAFTI